MPIHGYACRGCGHEFETLVATQGEKPVEGCGACGNPAGPGACRFN